jgi:drug/metabolite transporter (DMT)-like permease
MQEWSALVAELLGASRRSGAVLLLRLSETIHVYHVAGAALVVAGVYLATRPT